MGSTVLKLLSTLLNHIASSVAGVTCAISKPLLQLLKPGERLLAILLASARAASNWLTAVSCWLPSSCACSHSRRNQDKTNMSFWLHSLRHDHPSAPHVGQQQQVAYAPQSTAWSCQTGHHFSASPAHFKNFRLSQRTLTLFACLHHWPAASGQPASQHSASLDPSCLPFD